ncbi:MAG: methionyl-tRNA formyltransferase [Bacteroidetes bacterium]|nr:methionyl-tRNA formyltransferase [Bacteroidota bacterium]
MNKDKINIGYFADGPWSHLAFEKLISDQSLAIRFIVPRTDTQDDTLKNYANKYGIDYLFPEKVNSKTFLDKVNTYNCDLLVSMSFNQIFKTEIINLAPMGLINCHAGKLPFYRGRNILNWALINDEKEFGITVHYVDEGIDTGDIILQRTYQITDDDTYATLLEQAYSECATILYDAIKLLQNGNITRVKQSSIHPTGFYCGRRGAGDELIDWNQTSRRVFNFIRSICMPGPRAVTYLDGEPVFINKSRIINDVPIYMGKPGQILNKTKDGFLIKTQDTFIEIQDIQTQAIMSIGKCFKNN